MDPESLQKRDARRGSCLDGFLVMSIMFLFVAVTVVAAGGAVALMELRSKLDSATSSSQSETSGTIAMLRSNKSSSPYKMQKQNFAYLEAIPATVETSTISWDLVPYGKTTSVGSNFDFSKDMHTLKLKETGNYFMYVNLNFTCTSTCKKGLVTVVLGNTLTCMVHLPEGFAPVSKRCWTVSRMKADTYVQGDMTVQEGVLQNWKLDRDSAFGLFLVG